MNWPVLTLCAALAALGGAVLEKDGEEAPTLVIRAKRIYTLSDGAGVPEIVENGALLIRDGRIASVGTDIDVPKGVRVIDFRDGVIIPGLVAAGSRLAGYLPGEETVSAKYRALDAFDPYAGNDHLLEGGVTALYLSPDTRRLVSGRGAVVKTAGRRGARVLDEGSDLCVNLCESAYRPGGVQRYPLPAWSLEKIPPAIRQGPTARLGQYMELRGAFTAAREYGALKKSGALDGKSFDNNLEVLAETLAELPVLRIRALRAVDIEGALAVAEEMGFRAYLAGCTEAHLVADRLAASGLGVVYEISFRQDRPENEIGIEPGRMVEKASTAALLHEKGVDLALALPSWVSPSALLGAARLAVRGGLSEKAALEAVARSPARILCVDGRVGSLVPGRDADFAVLSGSPFDVNSHVREVFIDGSSVFVNPAGRDALVVRAGKVLTAAGEPIVNGEVLVEGGVIKAVGHTVPHPPGARIVDEGADSVVAPGLIDSHGHLGLERDKTVPGPDIAIHRAVAVEQDNFRRVASAGVTTVIMSPYGANSSGSRVAAVKTAGRCRKDLVVDELCAVKFVFTGKDPVLGRDSLRKPLKSGKKYFDSWKKYYEDLKKWEEEQAKKKKEAEEKGKAKTEKEKKTGSSKEKSVEEEKEEKADPLSGTWEGKISGGPIPEPVDVVVKLKLDDDGITVTGSASSPLSPEEVELSGTFQDNHLRVEILEETPMGLPVVEADIDREDHMTGFLQLGDAFKVDFEADRVEKEAPVIKVSRKKRKAGDKPEPPKVNEKLEPFRKLFAGEIPVFVRVHKDSEIEAVIKVVVEEFKAPLVLLGAGEAYKVKDKIKAAKTGVVARLPLVGTKDGKPYIQAADLSRDAIQVLFQSNAEDGARSLPAMAAGAVRNGMDATAALEALTINPARLFHIDDRVGSLRPGMDGDLVIYSGDPFNGTSRVLRVFVAGKEVEQ